ncbi:HAD-IB family phosphatase [Desulfovibrio sp. OttesenSCG-928-M14]|nr:HAD-IB family phosphatase [Desulfovibrio sp. OttesenSCG-928-M14]
MNGPVRGPKPVLCAFDLDGTVTACEMLPVIARLAGLGDVVSMLTRLTLSGQISFERSFRMRFALLRRLPLAMVHRAVEAIPLDPDIESFIRRRKTQCALITGNLDLWIAPLVKRLGCRCFSSRGMIAGKGLRLLSILDKGRAVTRLNKEGWRVIAVGESVNDVPMLDAAAVGVAFAGVHRPVPEIRRMAHYQAANGADLCALLESLAGPLAEAEDLTPAKAESPASEEAGPVAPPSLPEILEEMTP